MAKSNGNNAISAPFLIFLLFLGLKLGEVGVVSTWSWWWVTSPLWIPVCFVFSIAILAIIIIIIALIFGMSFTEIKEKAQRINSRKK